MLMAMVQVLALTPTHQAVPCRWDLECRPVSSAPPASGDGASPRSDTCDLRNPVPLASGNFTDPAVPHASGFGSRASHDGTAPLSYTAALFGPSAPRIHKYIVLQDSSLWLSHVFRIGES